MEVVKFEFSLADSELLEYTRQRNAVIVSLKLWNDEAVSLIFTDILAVQDRLGTDVSALVTMNSSEFRETILATSQDRAEDLGRYQSFGFLDEEGQLFFEIICASVTSKRQPN